MKIRLTYVLFLSILLLGCASTKRMNQISLGMSKMEVIEEMGTPDTSKGAAGVEYLIYTLREIPGTGAQAACGTMGIMTLGMAYIDERCSGHKDDYFVQLKNGQVSSYGTVGDFDSTKTPEATINVNKKIEIVE